MYEKIAILFILINVPILFFFNRLVYQLNLNDYPDNVRKFHENKVPLFGGILIIYNLTFFLLADYFLNFNFFKEINSKREYLTFIIGLFSFFCIGIFDDKYNLNANKKLIVNFFMLLFLILLDDNLVIKKLTFSFFENPVYLKNFSYFFTILCILLLVNAINMFDGINLQTGTYCIIIFSIFFYKDIYISISLILIYSLTLFLVYNFLNKIFLGDSGTNVLAFVISYILIKSYNLEMKFTADEIFIILIFPGLDMLRLFILRIFKGKNPFNPDRNHIHHLIQKKLNKFLSYLIIQCVILFNILAFYLYENKLFMILIAVFTYLLLYIIFLNREKKSE